jgi:LuxR family maltose regulon positive regulatory protein
MSGVDEVLGSSVRDELGAVGFVPLASKLYRPSVGLVPRSEHVALAGGADVVTVTAPAGYGKSTFLAQLAATDPRPTAWVSLTPADNDPASLLSYIALAIDEIEPVAPQVVSGLWMRSPTTQLQQFTAILADRPSPLILVLDDVHELVSVDVLDTLPALVGEMPAGSTIALGSRAAIPLPLGRVRTRKRLVEIGVPELAFDVPAAALLFGELGVDMAPTTIERLVEHTEGWPVALYLAALTHGTSGGVEVADDIAGDHRYLVEYFGDELLRGLDADVASFLMEASCFERISGGLCDDVLQRSGSAELIEAARQRNLLVIPLDERREWYRFHHLMAEFLHTELARRDPDRRRTIHLRVSEWYDQHGDADRAIQHALLGGDVDRAESMVVRWFSSIGTGQLHPSTARWLAMFPDDAIGHRPDLMAVAAWADFVRGDPGVALQWLARAAASFPERYPDDVNGFVGPVGLAVARALMAPTTPAEMAADAAYAYDHVGLGDGRPASCLARGAAAFMLGDEVAARRWLREGADTTLDRPFMSGLCLAHLALIDIEQGRWEDATIAARKARASIGDTAAIASSVLVLSVAVLVETHAGHGDAIEAERLLCRKHLTNLVDAAPWVNMQARVALARTSLLRGDRVEAAALLDEATAILEVMPGAVRVAEQVASLQREVAMRDRSQSFGPSALTTAELRVLQLLPTHLSIAEIADRLYVSRNTVKSQTISIYRKLGTSSRSGAVEIAVAGGLLG